MLLVEALFAAPNFERDAIGLFNRDIRDEGGGKCYRHLSPPTLDGKSSPTRRVGKKISVAANIYILQPIFR
jgi:hypothetical protein